MLLPTKIDHLTLARPLGFDGATETFSGLLDEPAGQAVIARALPTSATRDPALLAAVLARVQDLTAVKHPLLLPILQVIDDESAYYVLEEQPDAVDLGAVLAHCAREGKELPPNIFLNLATQICNALEALHGRPGKATGTESVLHLGLRPQAVHLTADGRVLVGGYDLGLPIDAADERALTRLAACSPEQTQAESKLKPSSDIFSLGGLLYHMVTLEPLFRAESGLQTLHAIRKAEVSAALQRVKRQMPGLDKVLYRALSLNPRHRYQRAFVLREDIRGLMAGYSFTRITDELSAFLQPIFAERAARPDPALPTTSSLDSTGALLRQAAIGGAASDPALKADRGGRDTLAPSAVDDLDGLEMWSEVPTSVDPTNPQALPVTTPPPAHQREAGSVPPDQTSWIRRNLDAPPTDAFDHDEATDISAYPSTPPPAGRRSPPTLTPEFGSIAPVKRQLTPAEAAELGIRQRRPSSEPTPARPDPTSTNVPLEDRPAPPPRVREQVVDAPTQRERRAQQAADLAREPSREHEQRENQPPDSAMPAFGSERGPERTAPRATAGLDSSTVDETLEDDLEWRPRRSNRTLLYVGAGIVVFLAVVVCGGSAIYGVVNVGQQLVAAAPVPSAPEPSALGEALRPAQPPEFPEFPDEDDGEPAAPADTQVAVAEPPPAAPPEPAATRQAAAPTPAAPAPTAPPRAATLPARDPAPATRTTAPATRTTAPATRTSPAPSSAVATTRTAPARTAEPRYEPPPPRPISDDLVRSAAILPTATDSAPPEIDALSSKARSGSLSAADKLTLEMVDPSDLAYTRAQTLLYEDAKARSDGRAQRKHLESILKHPENRYNPVFLAEGASLDIADRKYDRALERAELAERHWARLPSDLIFSRKAMIYEAQAAAWQGRFYTSGGDDLAALQRSIQGWERYQRHVGARNRTDLARVADEQLAKLYDARRRLE